MKEYLGPMKTLCTKIRCKRLYFLVWGVSLTISYLIRPVNGCWLYKGGPILTIVSGQYKQSSWPHCDVIGQLYDDVRPVGSNRIEQVSYSLVRGVCVCESAWEDRDSQGT